MSEVRIGVRPCHWLMNDAVEILIPPALWKKPGVAEAVQKAIQATWDKPAVEESDNIQNAARVTELVEQVRQHKEGEYYAETRAREATERAYQALKVISDAWFAAKDGSHIEALDILHCAMLGEPRKETQFEGAQKSTTSPATGCMETQSAEGMSVLRPTETTAQDGRCMRCGRPRSGAKV